MKQPDTEEAALVLTFKATVSSFIGPFVDAELGSINEFVDDGFFERFEITGYTF